MTKSLISSLALMLVAAPLWAQDFTRIESLETFSELALGKTLYLGDTTATAHADGTLTVVFKGKEIDGTWQWEDGYFCRVLKSYANKGDCQLWEHDGIDFRVTRDKGEGKSFVYTLE